MTSDENKLETVKRLERVAYCLVGVALAVVLVVATICLRPSRSRAPLAHETPERSERRADPVDENSFDAEKDVPIETSDSSEDEEIPPELADVDWDRIFDDPPIAAEESEDEEESDEEEEAEEDDEEEGRSSFDETLFPHRVVVPDDVETIAEALDVVSDGGVVLLKKRAEPYEFGGSRSGRRSRVDAVVRRGITLRSETERAADVVVLAPRDGGLTIDSGGSLVTIRDLTISSKATDSGYDFRANIAVLSGAVEIRDCVFRGVRDSNSGAVSTDSAFASVKCVGCRFRDYGGSAIYAASDSYASAIRSDFSHCGGYGIYVADHGKLNAVDSTFSQNGAGIYCESGVSGAIRNCVFKGNRRNLLFEDPWERGLISVLGNEE